MAPADQSVSPAPPETAHAHQRAVTIHPALTARSLAVGLPLLLLWIVMASWSMPTNGLEPQHLLLVSGFGALLTLFGVKFMADFLPLRWRPSPAEMTFVFAMVLAGIPATVMGRLAIESAMANHCVEGLENGRRGMIPDFWAPNPHIGMVPKLDPPDPRCPYLELPNKEDGSPSRAPLPPPPVAESTAKIEQALKDCDTNLAASRQAAKALEQSREVLDTIKEIESAREVADLARNATAAELTPQKAAYLAWAAQTAAALSARGPDCVRSADAVRGFRKGKAPVPWPAWTVPSAYWFAVMFSFCLVVLFGLMSLRASWIEKERLPFPYARVANGVLHPQTIETKGEAPPASANESFPTLLTAIAFFIGLLFCVKGVMSIGETADVNVAPTNTFLDLNLTWLDLIRGVSIRLIVMPFALLILLLFPLDLLLTVVIAYVVASFGLPYLQELAGISNRLDFRYVVLRMGGMLGVTVFIVIFHFAEIRRLVTGLWERARGSPHDALTPREMSVGFILTLSAFCLLVLIGEGPTGDSMLTRVLMLAYTLAMILMYSLPYMRLRAGGSFQYFEFNNILHTGSWFNWHWWKMIHTLPMAQGSKIVEPDSVLNYHSLYQLETFGAYGQGIGPGNQILDAFALAENTGARTRDIFKAMLIGFTLALLIGIPLYLIAIYHTGYDNTPMAGAWGSTTLITDKAERYYVKLNPGMFTANSLWWVVGGAALFGVCMYLRREYSRFPIEPMGLFLAGADGGRSGFGAETIWFSVIVALLIKWGIFRWYGVRTYQEKVMPAIVYCLMGMTLGMVIYLFLSAVILGRGMVWPV
jgi:hypothetical protein